METLSYVATPRVARYCIDGDPIALARPRFGDGRVYDRQKQLKLIVGISLQSQHDEAPIFDGPLSLNIAFYLPILSAKKFKLNTKPHTQTPDLSNLIKFYEDMMTSIVYKDDKTIACIVARKFYSTNPRTEIIISQIEDDIW